MTGIEDQIRDLLRDVAEEARPAPLLDRLEQHLPAVRRRRRSGMVVIALAVALVSAVVWYPRQLTSPEPTHGPPQVLGLSGVDSMTPGRSWMLVTVASSGPPFSPAYVVPAGAASAVAVPQPADFRTFPLTQRLSADGTRLLRMGRPEVEILDLVTGEPVEVAANVTIGELSHDNATLATYVDGEVRMIDVETGRTSTARHLSDDSAVYRGGQSVGWSPDDTRLATNDAGDVAIVDRAGAELHHFPGLHIVNGSQAWSPDGRSLLVYDEHDAVFAVQRVEGGAATPLRQPPGALRPLGWAGDRVVWLVGDAGSQRLVTTDRRGADEQLWLRFDIGNQPVETVMWSRELSG